MSDQISTASVLLKINNAIQQEKCRWCYLDLDNTLFNFGKGVRAITLRMIGRAMGLPALIEYFKKKLNEDTRELNTPEQAKSAAWHFLVVENNLFEILEPFEGAIEFVQKLHVICADIGIQLRVLTGCPPDLRDEATFQKMACVARWFGDWISSDEIFCVDEPSDDWRVFQKTTLANEFSILFDDRDVPRWIEAGGKAGIHIGTTATEHPDVQTYTEAIRLFRQKVERSCVETDEPCAKRAKT